MKRLVVMLSAIFLIACGGSDTVESGDALAVNSVGPNAAAGGEASSAPAAPTVSGNPQVTSCLGLARQAKLDAALPVCLAALEADPGNTEVRAAVEAARAKTASLAAAGARAWVDAEAAAATADAAAAADAGATAADAASQLGDAAGKLGR